MRTAAQYIHQQANYRWEQDRDEQNRERFKEAMIKVKETEAKALIIAAFRSRVGFRIDDLFKEIYVQTSTIKNSYILTIELWNGGIISRVSSILVNRGKVDQFSIDGQQMWKATPAGSDYSYRFERFTDALFKAMFGSALPEPEQVADYLKKYGIR